MITRANFAQQTQESGILTNKEFKETYEELSAFTDGFTRWDDMDDVPELQDVYNDFVAVLEKVIAKKQAAADASRSDEPTRAPKFHPGDKVKRLKHQSRTAMMEVAADAVGEIMSEGNWMNRFGSTGYTYRVQWDYTRVMEANAFEDELELYREPVQSPSGPKFNAGDRVIKAGMPGWGQGTVLANGSRVGNVYWYTVRWDNDGVAKGNSKEDDLEAAPANDPDRYVNEGKDAIRELLDKGKKRPAGGGGGKNPNGSGKNRQTVNKSAKPAKLPKAKFKVGQYVYFVRLSRIVQIDESEYKAGIEVSNHPLGEGWFYRESTIGWQHEKEFTLSTKREFDTRVADQNYFGSKQKVFATPEEVRHMKRFIGNAASSTKDGLTKAYKALQRAITSGKIRKTSSYANSIMLMQKEYHAALGNGAPYKVKPNDFDLSGIVKAVGGPTVYRSVKAMNYLVSKMGKTLDKKAIDAAIKYITGLRVPGADPFSIEVLDAVQMLRKAASNGGTLDIANANALDLQGLNGLSALMGLAQKCGCGGAGHSLSGLGNLPVASPQMEVGPGRRSGMKDTMTSHELENLSYTTLPLKGKWAELIGSPQTNFSMMVWGSPGAGKSTLMMQFSRYLAENHGNVLYVSSEEFPSYTLKTKLNLVGGAAHGWEFSKSLNSLRADHKFLVIDSTNHYRFTTADLKALMARRPDLSILLVVQITKGGNFKGDQSIEHEVDAVVKVTQEGATTIKNRFQPLSTVPVFDDSYSLTPQSNQPNVNQNRPTFY